MRIDVYLTEKGYCESRNKAARLISEGKILFDGKTVSKASFDVTEGEHTVVVTENERFVGRGGLKLEAAIERFAVDVSGKRCIDVGASTGGFTDCLLQRGAKMVFAVDLNDDLLHVSLKNNAKVVPVVKNAKFLTLNDFSKKLDLIVADLSFISVNQVIDVFNNLLQNDSYLIILIKPQFETGERKKFKNGIIKDKKLQNVICKGVYHKAVSTGFTPIGITTAPIQEGKNVEFLMLLKKGCGNKFDISQIDTL